MKILVVCQNYYPEPFRISDICEELVKRGNEVSVITATPNYPMGEIYKGYEHKQRQEEIINGVRVHRCDSAPRKKGVLNRIRNYYSFSILSKKYVKKLKEEFDVVFVNQLSPIMMASAGIKYKKKNNKKLVLYCLDLWPESLCVWGIKKRSLIYKYFKHVSKKIYQSCDKILVSSQMFGKYLGKKFNIDEKKLVYLPQYSEEQFLSIEAKPQTEEFRVLFAGNIGEAQRVDIIIDAAKLLKNENIKFDIVGDGIKLEECKLQAKGYDNIFFYGRRRIDEMPFFYQRADAMLITLVKDETISFTLPGKFQSYLASGRAIIGSIDGETNLLLNNIQGGYCGEAENSSILAKNILALKESQNACEIGKRNREYYLENFSKDKFFEKILFVFNDIKKKEEK